MDRLPIEWSTAALSEICRPKQHKTISKSEFTKTGYPVYGANGRIGYYSQYTHSERTLAITCRGATCGTINVVPPMSYITGNAMSLDNLKTDRMDFDFLDQSLRFFGVEQSITGSAQPQITGASLKSVILPVPPLPEQERIAEILTSVDDSIRATEAVIAQAERVKRGLMEDLLTGGLGSEAIMRGEVPDRWAVMQVGELAEVKGGKRMPKGAPFSEKPTPYPYVRVTDFKGGTISKEDLKFVSEEHHAQIARYTISKDDIYISIAGTLGVVGLVPENLDGAQLTENAAKIVLKGDCEISKEYLALVLQSEVGQSQIHVRKGVGGGVPKLALFRIAEINVPVPPTQEQKQTSRAVGSIDKSLLENSKAVEQLQRLKRGLMDDLLTGRVRTV